MFPSTQDVVALLIIIYFCSGWCLGVWAERSKQNWLWKTGVLVWFAGIQFLTVYTLIPAEVRWQWEATAEHNTALLMQIFGFAVAFMAAIWGGGLTRIRTKKQESAVQGTADAKDDE